MPYAPSDGIKLYYEEAGKGLPILFVHEFSGDLRSWEPQIQHFSRRYRCIAFNARGYTPSDAPETTSKYSPQLAVKDIAAVLQHCGVQRAHIVGCSMGAQATLLFGLAQPRRALTLTAIGCASNAGSAAHAAFLRDTEAQARRFEEEGNAAVLARVKRAPNRLRLRHKNPRALDDFCRRFLEHSPQAKAAMLRGIQARRTSIYALENKFRKLTVPTHIVCGDEDDNALSAGVFIKRTCAAAQLSVAPSTGHLVNQEEPAWFNRLAEDFFAVVEARQWRARGR